MKAVLFLLIIVYTCFSLNLHDACQCADVSSGDGCSLSCGQGLYCAFINSTATYRECVDCSFCNQELNKHCADNCQCRGRGTLCNNQGYECCDGFKCASNEFASPPSFGVCQQVCNITQILCESTTGNCRCRKGAVNLYTGVSKDSCSAQAGSSGFDYFSFKEPDQCEVLIPGMDQKVECFDNRAFSNNPWRIYKRECVQPEVEESTTDQPDEAKEMILPVSEDNSRNPAGAIMGVIFGLLFLCCCVYGVWYCKNGTGDCETDLQKLRIAIDVTNRCSDTRKQTSTVTPKKVVDSELESALKIVKVFSDAKLKIIRLIQRSQRTKGVPGKERTYQEIMYQIERQQEKLIRMLEDKYQDKARIERFKPHLEHIWEEARQGRALPQQTTTRPSIQARQFFQYFDYENCGSMSLAEFAPVAQLIDPTLQMDTINLFFDFMKGDAIDCFENWHVEEFIEASWDGKLEKFKLDLIRYMNDNTTDQSRQALSEFYGGKSSQTTAIQSSNWGNVELTERNATNPNLPGPTLAGHKNPSMATSHSSDNTHLTSDLSSSQFNSPDRPRKIPMFLRNDSGTTISSYHPSDRGFRMSMDSAMTASTNSTMAKFLKGSSNEQFNQNLHNFEDDQMKTLSDLYEDIEKMESQETR